MSNLLLEMVILSVLVCIIAPLNYSGKIFAQQFGSPGNYFGVVGGFPSDKNSFLDSKSFDYFCKIPSDKWSTFISCRQFSFTRYYDGKYWARIRPEGGKRNLDANFALYDGTPLTETSITVFCQMKSEMIKIDENRQVRKCTIGYETHIGTEAPETGPIERKRII